ncbi:cbb3-type cytochrome c oxidase subunit I [Prosthecobacter sp.]|uniref:cytochrome c oxidase subunit I n=1 Tax=Prosthecobacter sp. TaxID=1965333 RepID=UPI001D2CD4F7|nr:cbb3-type cytochrome c oxidase subunit I [Prosthecobacter sp.]MCB1279368.1 cbb3-type cytochrome c oxidase subunit I [Prosthecobacter sp.]
MSAAATTHDHAHDHAHDDHAHGHHQQNFVWKYIFSTDHKTIGMQYGLTGLIFLLFGFFLMLLMRWSIAYPGVPVPAIETIRALPAIGDLFEAMFGRWLNADGSLNGELYNMLGAMHGTIMVFFGIVPLGFAAFGNFVMPLQIGTIDMAFPRLNMMSYWFFFISCVLMMYSFFVGTGPVQTGWTMYSPLASTANIGVTSVWNHGHTWWLTAMVFNISASLLGSVNFIATIINLRTKGMTWMKMPFFCWAMFVTAFLLLLAFPPLEVAAILQLSDRVFGSSFYLPTGLMEGGKHLDISGGGSPLLYQHLFWFLAHPEVYVLILPAFAILTDIIPCNARRPLWGYKSMVYSVLTLGFLSFLVWAHHMYLTGMGTMMSTYFQITTVLISVPSVILLTCMMISLWGGSIRFNTQMLFASAFLPMFGIGGLTGLPLAFAFIDLALHDTYYVIGHFHYVVAPGTIFALFAGVYHWFPKITGRFMNDKLGKWHFWPSLVGMNLVFAPMFIQGMAGFHRRWYDGGKYFENTSGFTNWSTTLTHKIGAFFGFDIPDNMLSLNIVMSIGAFILALGQVPFIINFWFSIKGGKKTTSDNPWDATTMEWATPTPPPHGNFLFDPVAHRGPYEYSVPGHGTDFYPQWESEPGKPETNPAADKVLAHH